MDPNTQIISDLQHKIGSHQKVDLLSKWRGMPVLVIGEIHQVLKESIIFRVQAPYSISLKQNKKVLILYDTFIMAIQGRVLAFDPQTDFAKIGEFSYTDHGYGNRSMVRVEPENPITGKLVMDGVLHTCQVVDISLNGFGLLTKPTDELKFGKGQSITIKTNLLNQEIKISGTLVGIFPTEDSVRLSMSFSYDAPCHEIVSRFIAQRRVEIRQEIQNAYQEAVKEPS